MTHGFWRVELPAAWVTGVPGLADLLAGRCGRHGLIEDDPKVKGVLALLDHQGCFTCRADADHYTGGEILELFRALAIQWYASYYGHPIWEMLRTGSLPRPSMVAWAYHVHDISRSAGVTAARAASRTADPALREVFAQSARSEYAHFAQHFRLADLAGERPSAIVWASGAFDQQMLRMADTDVLGHLLAAAFQEMSAGFGEGCERFYTETAASYGLGGFFETWLRHLAFDLDEDHAAVFTDAIGGFGTVGRRDLVRSLSNAWFAYRFLYGALDEIIGASPPATGAPPPHEDVAYLRSDAASTVFEALGHASRDDEILAFGRLAEAVDQGSSRDVASPRTHYAMALANVLRSEAARPAELAALLVETGAIDVVVPSLDAGGATRLRAVARGASARGSHERWRAAHRAWSVASGGEARVDFFGG